MSLTDFVSKIFAMDLTEQQRLLLEMYEEMKYIKSTTFYTPNITGVRSPIDSYAKNSGVSRDDFYAIPSSGDKTVIEPINVSLSGDYTPKELLEKMQDINDPNT